MGVDQIRMFGQYAYGHTVLTGLVAGNGDVKPMSAVLLDRLRMRHWGRLPLLDITPGVYRAVVAFNRHLAGIGGAQID